MFTRGIVRVENYEYKALLNHTNKRVEIILIDGDVIYSAYRKDDTGEYSYKNNKAKQIWDIINRGLRGCSSRNRTTIPFDLGVATRHAFTRVKRDYIIDKFDKDICGVEVNAEDGSVYINLTYTNKDYNIPDNIPYIKLTTEKKSLKTSINSDDILVRTIEEIALEKEDVSWLKGKRYYIVNDEEKAERIFSYLDNYNGVVAFDTETTGLKINCFSKVNSRYKRSLDRWNEEHPEEYIRADKLVGIIFCIEKNVSYYFPVANRKFKNLYEDIDNEIRKKVIQKIKARYTFGDLRDREGDMKDYILNTPEDEITPDVVLMERVRDILEKKHIVTHGGSFDWKVCWCYEIDLNIKDDTMIMHQLMYKFRSAVSNRGETSKLKYLAKKEFGVDQWELGDFFVNYSEDDDGKVRGKKSNKIDFSYMTYDGTRIYAPCDGDMTLQLFYKYKTDLLENHKELEYLYNVEVIVTCAIGYMEFYGHRIDESKIAEVRDITKAEIVLLESELRQMAEYSTDIEVQTYKKLKSLIEQFNENKNKDILKEIVKYTDRLRGIIDSNIDNSLNLASPLQVAELFYDKMKIPFKGDKKSVDKRALKPLLKAKNEDGSAKYPILHKYAEYKEKYTLLTKFFDNLQYFMYPGGYIFSNYGQIDTATGRMSCRKPNAQQYPKSITKIVVPRDNCVMVDADYSQIEYRVLVALAGEDKLAELFNDPDSDYHTLMASLMYGVPYAAVTPEMRSDAKAFNFGIPYGMGIRHLALSLTGRCGPSEIEQAKEKYELYFKDQPNVRKFFDKVKEMALVNKYTKTYFNRYRHYSFIDKDGNYSEAKKASSLRQAGNAVIQGTAADIFKIAVARIFTYIRKNSLYGLFFITNMIHDELLFEIDVSKLNAQRILRDIGINMQFRIKGFPPLYIGAGVGSTWNEAKGKLAEIHPYLLEQLSREADDMPIFIDKPINPDNVYKYFADRVYRFRVEKIKSYLLNEENHGKELHPAIGNLLNLQFTYGHNKNKEGLTDDEFTVVCLKEFIKHNNLDIDIDKFKLKNNNIVDDDEDVVYIDEEDELYEEDYVSSFTLLDESDKVYGTSIHDLIKMFGYVVSKSQRICGIDVSRLNRVQKDNLIDYLYSHVCNREDEGSMEIVFLYNANILKHTDVWVKDVKLNEIEERLHVKDKIS